MIQSMMVFRGLLVSLLLAASGLVGNTRGEEISSYTTSQLRSRDTTRLLRAETSERSAELRRDLAKAKAEDDKKKEEDLELELEILSFSRQWLERALSPSSPSRDVYDANAYVERILRTSSEGSEEQGLPPISDLFRNILVGALVGQPMPHVGEGQRDRAIGAEKAALEAANLYQPGRDSYFTADELAGMSPKQIAELDVSPDHPIWYSRSNFPGTGTAFPRYESLLQRGMTSVLHNEGDLDPGRSYDVHSARKVLFLEEIYLSATSAKGTAEDAFGVEWKVKWGDEVAVEPVTGHLYLMAGAKITDVTYSNGFGPDALVLVLLDPEDAEEEREKEKDDERYPTTVEELKAAVDEFYGFNLAPYIHSHGVITHENVDSILRNLPSGGKKKYRREKAIGRQWVAFRESGVEFKPQGFLERMDGSRMSDLTAANDRAYRGMYLFNMWISNPDAKDLNNKSYFVRGTSGLRIEKYREGHHDMGLALGSLWASGEVNKFETGSAFAHRGLFGKLRFPQAVIFRPAAWDAATWSDLRWMAERIVGISDDRIRDAVAAGDWPDFAQEAMVYKLQTRRDRIGELFGVTGSGTTVMPPTITYSLGTPEEIRIVERHFGLVEGSLAEELAAEGKRSRYRETVLKEGVIADSKRSAIVRLLTRQRYPSGLDTRYRRASGKEPKALNTE